MAYLIGSDEPADKAIRRVLREQSARILALLSQWEAEPADSIHRARQSLLLGHAQDLELLEALLRQQPDALRIDTHVQRLRHLIASSLVQLRHRALEVGGELIRSEAARETEVPGISVTEWQRDGKETATTGGEHAPSLVRPVISDRDPDSSRRRQYP